MFTMYIVNSGKEYRGEWGRSFCRGLTKDGESRFTVSFSGIPFAQLQAESHNQSKWKVPTREDYLNKLSKGDTE